MIVKCSQCATKFKIADEKISEKGVKVRCSKCKNMFLVMKDGTTKGAEAGPPAQAVKKEAKPAAARPQGGSTLPPPPALKDGPTMKVGMPDRGDYADSVHKAETRVSPPPPGAGMPPGEAKDGLCDVFSKPTTVSPAPQPRGGAFPVPPPQIPSDGGKSLADKIDLDGDEKKAAAPSAAPPKPAAPAPPPPPPPPPRAAASGGTGPQDKKPAKEPTKLPPPPQAGKAGEPSSKSTGGETALGDDLFEDIESPKQQKAPQEAKPVAPPSPTAPLQAPPPLDAPLKEKAKAVPTSDDPFAGIDISDAQEAPSTGTPPGTPLQPAAETSPQDPTSGEAVGKPTEDLFGGLGDPFAELPPAQTDKPAEKTQPGQPSLPTTPPPAPGPDTTQAPIDTGPAPEVQEEDPFASIDLEAPATQPPAGTAEAPGADPFASLDSGSESVEEKEFSDALAGNDPFGQLDSGTDTGESPSGLQLDEEGKLTGEEPPAPPPPSKQVAVPDSEQIPEPVAGAGPAMPAPMAASAVDEPASAGALWIYKIGFGIIALLMALLLFVAYRSGGKPDLTSWDTYVQAFSGKSATVQVAGELGVEKLNNTLYPNRLGQKLLVVWGEVSNQTEEKKESVVVTGSLLDSSGEAYKEKTVPAGVEFSAYQIYEMTDPVALDMAYRDQLEDVSKTTIDSGGKIPFMVVFFDYPEDRDDLQFFVLPEESEAPLQGLSSASEEGPEAEEKATGAELEEGVSGEKGEARNPPVPVDTSKDSDNASHEGKVIKKKGDFIRMTPIDNQPDSG